MPIDLAALAASAADTSIPETTINRVGEPNPFLPLIDALDAARGTAKAFPFEGDDKAYAAVSRKVREAAAERGVSARQKRDVENKRVVVWVIDRVTRAKKAKDETEVAGA